MASNFAELQNMMAAAAEELNELKSALTEHDAAVEEATSSRDSSFGDYQFAINTLIDHKVLTADYFKALGYVVPRRPAKADPVADQQAPSGEELDRYIATSLDALAQLNQAVRASDTDVDAITERRDDAFGRYQDKISHVLDVQKIYTPEMLESIGHVKARRPKRK